MFEPYFFSASSTTFLFASVYVQFQCIVISIVDDSEKRKILLGYVCNECFSLSRINESMYIQAHKRNICGKRPTMNSN